MSTAHRTITLSFFLLLLSASAWSQERMRVIGNRSPILAHDFVTTLTYVDAGSELIVVGEQGNWVEVVLPGLNPRRDTGFIARTNIGPLRGATVRRAPDAPPIAEPPPPTPPPVSQQPTPTPESARSSQQRAVAAATETRISLLGTGLRGFAKVGIGSFLAHQSFDAVLGSSKIRGPWFGGGAQYQFRQGLFVEGEIAFFRQTGEHVFVNGDTIFKLGIPDTLTLLPVSATAGYRFHGRTVAPFVGGGIGQYVFSEKTPFDESAEHAWERANSYHVLGGVEFHAARGVGVAVQARYTRVPDALTGGVATVFNEDDLGGFQVAAKLLVGR